MNRYAILLGSAPAGFTQEKIVKMHDFLVSQDGGRFNEKEIMILSNGADEKMLLFVMQNLKEQGGNTKLDYFLLYICTDYAAEAEEKSFFLCGEEIKQEEGGKCKWLKMNRRSQFYNQIQAKNE